MKKSGFSVGLVPFFPCGDRFLPTGYRKDELTLKEKLEKVSEIEDVIAVELDYPTDFGDPVKMKTILEEVGLLASNIEIDLFGDKKWKYGTLSSRDEKVRREAINLVKRGMDAAVILGTKQISLWLGQDGFDYPMQIDYQIYWENTISAIEEIGKYREDVKVCIEYKSKEPRVHIQFGTIGKTLSIVNSIGLKNIGVLLDVGHALMAYENPAESAVLLNKYNRLFHIHFNDNFGYWDDDLIVGSVHLWETIELLYWLKKINYEGWYSLDIFPYREESLAAIKQSIKNLKTFIEITEKLDEEKVYSLQKENDAARIIEVLREVILK